MSNENTMSKRRRAVINEYKIRIKNIHIPTAFEFIMVVYFSMWMGIDLVHQDYVVAMFELLFTIAFINMLLNRVNNHE